LTKELEILRKKLRERMNDVADSVASGRCADFGEYQKLCGVIEGLAYAERDLLDLAETMKKENDE
jgi:hypothetical protein